MYILKNKEGYTLKTKNGSPFVYSQRWLADLGKRILEKERDEKLYVVKQ